jgi:hypothetical protein
LRSIAAEGGHCPGGTLLQDAGKDEATAAIAADPRGGGPPPGHRPPRKAIIAYLPESKLRSLLAKQPMIAQTPNSITTMSRLLEELATTRQRGYAVDDHEHELNSSCIAATIFDSQGRPVGAISISGRELEPLLQHIPTLQHTAEVISHVV